MIQLNNWHRRLNIVVLFYLSLK